MSRARQAPLPAGRKATDAPRAPNALATAQPIPPLAPVPPTTSALIPTLAIAAPSRSAPLFPAGRDAKQMQGRRGLPGTFRRRRSTGTGARRGGRFGLGDKRLVSGDQAQRDVVRMVSG